LVAQIVSAFKIIFTVDYAEAQMAIIRGTTLFKLTNLLTKWAGYDKIILPTVTIVCMILSESDEIA
jgi:hypothetical protein